MEDVNEDCCFISVQNVCDEFFFLTKFGKVYKLCKIDESILSESLLNVSCNETLLNNTILERVLNDRLQERASCMLALEIEEEIQFLINAGRSLYFKCGSRSSCVEIPQSLKNLYDLENFILGLTTEGSFVLISPLTRLVQDFPVTSIENLMILESNPMEIELLMLAQPDEDGDRQLKIVDFPTMKCKSELLMQGEPRLVCQQKSSINMYYLNCLRNEEGNFCAIEMRLITENEPMQRLKKLIQRGHFREAEDFANQFELSLQPIHEAKARIICHQFKADNMADADKKFDELMALLRTIESKFFFINISEFEFSSRKLSERFLQFLIEKLDAKEHLEQVKQINEKILRIETLRLIDPRDKYVQWRDFVHHRDLKVSS